MTLSRREFVQVAAAMGASLAWSGAARASRVRWKEARDVYPEGVASGDPDPSSVILWTRRPFESGDRHLLTVEVAEDEAFRRVVTQAPAPASAAADWTSRVLVGGLKPSRTYWYRFTDAQGNGSRIGRTRTAPLSDDSRNFWIPVHKLFDGTECLRDRNIAVRLSANHVNEKIRRAHLFFAANGHNNGWYEPDISNPPFIFSDGIAEFSEHAVDDVERLIRRRCPTRVRVLGRNPGPIEAGLLLRPRPSARNRRFVAGHRAPFEQSLFRRLCEQPGP